ncbi:late embryogenesis abundant (LEA) protein-like protein [Actinidia rufa]|uniref:Late embryogenesis abundant (LEA) protein-like protein n=1 Tax=Actinidia rufa TaxID=165716 RepID=A0A7J0GF92_9ERIC|nr:late embryogenesis abundant (LEA) protein-like protein [Actinidia rufa]
MEYLLPSQKGNCPPGLPRVDTWQWSAPARRNSVTVMLLGMTEVSVNVVPVTKQDDRMHNYQIPSDDCFAHLESPVKRDVPMPVMGGEDKYKTFSLVCADCKYCIFAADGSGTVPWVLDSSSMTVDCTSRMSDGQGFTCLR